ncbi:MULTISPECIES: bifunctional precorrin-2 dehydrogenase/sirohydrochlorin ferrochelatase [Methanobrevibacter]|uniref:precorrin-2 dehydrogenase/sirohydrochlorin ferrochelatase family protein n=1 Tax=Methanobrevibacter TaxID=2172 RepID=UPI0025F8AA16|nr:MULTISPECIES: bifunctional precorrin-2 dehydrogenase/sirohydrochlorin ferrochelatase [Methanobrevibacter]MBS7256984.1 bifunctional precorrin-2 dehydrogenase/sirohydrochlorin ferrochelatase [Methanobrevibacter sp.]MCI7429182.1 bifunctional precorrin-2 dehydrogenase/sirohydrochlorin ferrochelatase [Methanobrevibacter sp.]MDD6776256.1 bifunctional precorrin-2 dehydrogenase/sirohydrochlorin ferrochelatase [Methanobacteriaceae archaeon]MDY3097474.1 bifunctional precorrin-2 dehydrogenase/sirohydro
MDWTSIYLKTSNLNVFILGTGEVATRRANKFLDHGANVKLAGDNLADELVSKGAILCSTEDVDDLVEWSDFVVIASGDRTLSNYVSKIAEDKLLNRADFPSEGNVIVPTSFNIGDIEISIFTGGKSPLMARQLRKKIQSIITEEDILEIELQDYARNKLKGIVQDQKDRRKCLYEIFEDEKINVLIKNRNIVEAKDYIDDLIRGLN